MENNNFDQKYTSLTQRQQEILQGFLDGKEDEEIAKSLLNLKDKKKSISPATVRQTLQQIREKFGCTGYKTELQRTGTDLRKALICLFIEHKPELVCQEYKDRYKNPPGTSTSFTKLTISGILPLNSPLYLEREIDKDIKNQFIEHQENSSMFLKIKGTKGLGKTNLLIRLRNFLESELKHQVGYIDLESFTQETIDNYDSLMFNLARSILKAFKKEPQNSDLVDLNKYFNFPGDRSKNCTEYLDEKLFSQIQPPKTLLIDGIDKIFGHQHQHNFLQLLRGWGDTNLKYIDSNTPVVWPHFVLAYSTIDYMRFDKSSKTKNSPLDNIGIGFDLLEFSEEETRQQARKFPNFKELTNAQIDEIIQLIEGHPYLLNKILLGMSQGISLDTIVSEADQRYKFFYDYLGEYLEILKKYPEICKCFLRIIQGESCPDDYASFQLEKMGLIKIVNRKPYVRYGLYSRYFKKNLSCDFERDS